MSGTRLGKSGIEGVGEVPRAIKGCPTPLRGGGTTPGRKDVHDWEQHC